MPVRRCKTGSTEWKLMVDCVGVVSTEKRYFEGLEGWRRVAKWRIERGKYRHWYAMWGGSEGQGDTGFLFFPIRGVGWGGYSGRKEI